MPITYDPLLAEKIFDAKTYKEQAQIQKATIDTRIKTEVYGNNQHNPIYYQGEKNPVSLNVFLNSAEFNNFKKELVTIKEHLGDWLDEHRVHIQKENPAGTISSVSAREILEGFFSKLAGDAYSDFRVHLYSEGKKYLETILVLLKDESIDLAVRKTAMINLFSDGGLEHCATGCYTRLEATADHLSSVNKKSLISWIFDYLFETADKISATSPGARSKTYVEKLCDAIDVDFRSMQIHARNYLLAYAVEHGRLPLKVTEDTFLSHFRDNADCDVIAKNYLATLSKKINAQSLSAYIADKLHDLAKTHIANSEAVALGELDRIRGDFDNLGSDNFFQDAEIISDEGALKASHHLEITAMERLLNKAWLNSDKLSSGLSEEMRYTLFIDNIPLSWVKKTGEVREQLRNLAKTPEGLEDVDIFWNTFLRSEGYVPPPNILLLPEELVEHYRLATKVFKSLLVDMQLKKFKGWDLKPVNFQEIEKEYLNWEPKLNARQRMTIPEHKIPIKSSTLFVGIDFSEADLQKKYLPFLDFSQSKFINANLKEVNLRNTQLKSADLSGADLREANVDGTNFENADLSDTKLEKIKGTGETNFENVNLKNANLQKAELEDAILTNANLEGADLRHANFNSATFTDANLEGADLRHANFEAAELTNIKLKNAKLNKACLRGAGLENTDLQGVNFKSLDLQEARLKGANLKNAILVSANLDHANLVNADLTNVDLRRANLRNANLQNANLQDANFRGADMRGILGTYDRRGTKRKIDGNDDDASFNKRPAIDDQMDIEEPISLSATSLEAETFLHKDYKFALQKHDIEAIGKAFYFNRSDLFFEVIDLANEIEVGLDPLSSELIKGLYRFKNSDFSARGRGVFIVNLGSGHWITLMVFGPESDRAGKLNIYYIDSLGKPILPELQALIESYGPNRRGTHFQKFLEDKPQTSDSYNSALWSMENAKTFDNILQKMELPENLDRDELIREWKYHLLDYPIEQKLLREGNTMDEFYFQTRRLQFSKLLLKDPKRLENYKQQVDAKSIENAAASLSCLSIRSQVGRQRRQATDECSISEKDREEITVKKTTDQGNNENIVDSTAFFKLLDTCNDVKRSQLLKWAAASEVSITGDKQYIVQRLIRIEGIKPHLKLTSEISSGLMQGVIAKDTLADLLKDDGKTAAINLGFMGAGHGLGKLSELAAAKGESLLVQGENLLGKSLKITAPFLSRGTSLFIAYDLFNQFKALESGDKHAIAGVIGDSLMLSADLVTTGIEVAEIAGLEVLAGISSVAGPLSAGFSAIIMVIMQIYSAVKIVSRLDDLLHLTGWEKFKEGWRGFLGMPPEEYIQKMADLKQHYQLVLGKKLKMLQEQPSIKRYIFAASNATIVCEDVETKRLPVRFFAQGDSSWPKPTKEVCETRFPSVKLSFADFRQKRYWSQLLPKREIPKSPTGSDFICIPCGKATTLYRLMDGVMDTYLCNGAMGISDKAKTEGASLFDFPDGQRTAFSSLGEPAIFMVRNEIMHFTGGNKKDLFILQANSVKGVQAILNGGEDEDTLDLSTFSPSEKPTLNLREQKIECGKSAINISSIENFIGRNSRPESFIAGCNTRILNTQGGTKTDKDTISILQDVNCDYVLKMPLHPNTVVYNNATRGNFSYIILPGVGETVVNLPLLGQATHQFMFNSTVADLQSIAFQPSEQAVGIPVRHTASFHFENFAFNASAIAPNTTSFYFQDGAELRIGDKQNAYIFYTDIKSSIDNIIDIYSPIANRLNMTFFLSLEENRLVIIGHGKHEVMHNDPTAYETHLVGNGGENLFAIEYGRSSNVVLYQRADDHFTDTLDISTFTRQIRSQFNSSTVIKFIPPNKHNKLGNDVMLLLDSGYLKTTIRFRNSAVNHWYKNLHILDVAPQKIVGPLSNLRLKPIPLEFTVHNRVIAIGPNDVEKNTKIIIPRILDHYSFFRDQDNLIVTDALAEYAFKKNRYCFILLYNFYSSPKLASLTIQLPNRNIVLKHKLEQINAAPDFNHSWNTGIKDLYEHAFNQTSPHETNQTNVSMEALTSNISLSQAFTSEERVTTVSQGAGSQHRHRHGHGSHFRRIRSIDVRDQKPIVSSAVKNSGILQTLVGHITYSFFADKRQKPRLSQASHRPVFHSTINICDKNTAPKSEQCFKTTALSKKVITPPSKWRRPIIELGTGAVMGGVGAVFDKLIESYPNRRVSFTMTRFLLDVLITSSSHFLSSAAHELEFEDAVSPFMKIFASNLFIMGSLQSLLIGLEASDRPLCKQIKKSVQIFYNFFFLMAMFNFFVSDESKENKLTELLHWTCHTGASMGGRKVTQKVMNTYFFNSDSAKKEESDARATMDCSSSR